MKQHFLLLLVLLLVDCSFAFQINPDQQSTDRRSRNVRIAPFRLPRIRQVEQFVPYFTVETGWRTDLQLRNNISNTGDVPAQYQTLTVTPVARFANGQTVQLADVKIDASNVVSVDVESAIREKLSNLPDAKYGSLLLRYTAFSFHNLYAMAMIHDHGYPIAFHIDGSGISKRMEKGSREGVWWLPNTTANSHLVVSNYTDKVTPVTITIRGASESRFNRKFTIGGNETARFSIRQLRDEAGIMQSWGSISVHADANAGGLDSVAFVYDETAKFSAYLKMFDKDPGSKREERAWHGTADWTLRAPAVALSNPDPALLFPAKTELEPKVFIHNTSAQPIDYVMRLDWTGTDGKGSSAVLPAKQIGARETQLLLLADLQRAGLLPLDVHWATVSITAVCQPEDLIAMTASYDSTMRYGVQNPFSDYLGFQLDGGKWQVDATHNSISTIGNGTDRNVGFTMTILYGQGTQRYELLGQLGPHERTSINIGQLIRMRVPDLHGKVFPPDLTWGSYLIRETDRKGYGALFEGKVIIDKTFGSVTYGCFICGGYSDPGLFDPNSTNFAVNDQSSPGITATNGNTGYTEYVTGYYDNWWTDNSAVASAPSWDTWQGNSAGTTNGYAYGNLPFSDGAAVERPQDCRVYPDQPQQPVAVQLPDHVTVVVDNQGFPAACPSTGIYVRQMQMQVVDSAGTAVFFNPAIQENYSSLTTNTCGNGQPIPSSCAATGFNGFLGQFLDTMAVSGNLCASGIQSSSGCGFSLTSTWSLCGGLIRSLWTSPRTTKSNSASVNGSNSSFPQGTPFH